MSEILSDLKDELATILKERNDLAMQCDALKSELAEAKREAMSLNVENSNLIQRLFHSEAQP